MKAGPQHTRAADAVHVVIAVNDDRSVGLDGPNNPVCRLDDARQLFERLIGVTNDVGLLSEEYDPTAKRLLGNFPQAMSHVALVNTAANLTGTVSPARSRSGVAAARPSA